MICVELNVTNGCMAFYLECSRNAGSMGMYVCM
jgi:hypothetical protein